MTPAPGRIGARFDDILPPRIDSDPLTEQETPRFKQAVAEVAHAFAAIEAGGAR